MSVESVDNLARCRRNSATCSEEGKGKRGPKSTANDRLKTTADSDARLRYQMKRLAQVSYLFRSSRRPTQRRQCFIATRLAELLGLEGLVTGRKMGGPEAGPKVLVEE